MEENKSISTKTKTARILQIIGSILFIFSIGVALPFYIISLSFCYKREDSEANYTFYETLILLIINILFIILSFL